MVEQNFDKSKQGQLLKWLRKELGSTQQEFAETIGLPQSNYSQMENGKRLLTLNALNALLIGHEVRPDFFFTGDKDALPHALRDRTLPGNFPS